MEITNYIASGMIEGYLFGLATPEERAEFERRLKLEPELQDEYIKAQHLLKIYTSGFASRFPGEVESIWNMIQSAPQPDKIQAQVSPVPSESQQEKPSQTDVNNYAASEAPDPTPVPSEILKKTISATPKVSSAPQAPGKNLWTWVSFFFLLLFIGVAAWALTLKKDRDAFKEQAEEQIVLLNAQAATLGTLGEKHKSDSIFLSFLNQEGTKVFKLVGEETLMLGWNSIHGKVWLWDMQWPQPESGKVYILWSMRRGKPLGKQIMTGNQASAIMETSLDIKQADQFLITMEEASAEKPDLEETIAKSNN